jgi:acyl-CoA thioester hydrolase
MRGGEILTEADVTAALVGAAGRAVRQPRDWIAAFAQVMGEGVTTSGDQLS